MPLPTSSVLRVLEPDDVRPVVQFRQAGDHQILIEYGEMEFDLRLNFHVHALLQELDHDAVDGVIEAAPGFRSAMITFDAPRVERAELVDALADRVAASAGLSSLVIPSRVVTLPVAFDDEATREAVHRYRITTRIDAPNVGDGDNIDYIVRYNGFASREGFYERFLATTWWNAFVGYFPGLPSLFALDPLAQIAAPKYNPARMWTAEGAVGIGGPCVVLYPIEAPGGYQLFGRTLPIRSYRQETGWGRSAEPVSQSQLFEIGDQVQFIQVSEEQLLEQRLQVLEGTYEFDVVAADFVVAEHLAEWERLAPEAERIARQRQRAAEQVEIP